MTTSIAETLRPASSIALFSSVKHLPTRVGTVVRPFARTSVTR